MAEPKYDEDTVNLGYLKKVISDTEESIDDTYKNVSRHYASRPQPPYNKGDTWIDGNIVYVCISSRQIGLYTDSDWVTESGAKEKADNKNKTYLTQPSNYRPGDMWILQGDNDHKAGKKGEILISTVGRAEYDEGDWINMLGYGTIRSINEVADNLNNAINRIGNVEDAIEDGLIVTFYQDSEPEGKHIGDLWYVTGEVEGYIEGKIYRYDGTSWVILDDPAIQKAFDEANEARIVADGKIQSFYSDTEPTEGVGVGDLWIDIDNNNQLYRYNGTKWVAVYDTRINELVVNVETVTERVATIETDLGEIDLKVQQNTTKVTTIEGNIDSIQENMTSMQAQIDGSIQFWNGSDIPTTNNYPANEWTTEEEKNKHRADIYTVIEDIDGELKQGKSYRFDKVSNTWQWIELTDNELSAVQALAQSKAKVFVATPTVPYNVGDLWLKDGKLLECQTTKDNNGSFLQTDWKEAVNYTDDTVANLAKTLANNAQSTANSAVERVTNITNTTGQAEGKSIYITDSAEEPLVDITLHGETNQATRSGKNLFDKNNSNIVRNRYLGNDGSLYAGNNYAITDYIPVNANTNYVSSGLSVTGANPSVVFYDSNKNFISGIKHNSKNPIVFTTPENCKYIKDTFYLADIETFMIEAGSVATSYEPYGAMPSPEFPSEIENVEGKNLLNLINTAETMTPSSEITYSISNQKLILNGSSESNKYPWMVITKNAIYSKNGTPTASNITTWANGTIATGIVKASKRILSGSSTSAFSMTLYDETGTNVNNSLTEETKIVAVGIYLGNGQTFDNCIIGVQLEKGTVATEYVPYNTLEVKVTGRNKFNYEESNTKLIVSNATKMGDIDNGYWYKGNTSDSTIENSYSKGQIDLRGCKLKANTRYTISFDAVIISNGFSDTLGIGYRFNGADKGNCGKWKISTTKNRYNITLTEKTEEFTIYFSLNSNEVQISNICITLDDSTDYEPYKSQTAYFPLAEGQKLMEGSYLADDGVHNVRKQVVLDGSSDETYGVAGEGNTIDGFSMYTINAHLFIPNIKEGTAKVLRSNYFQFIERVNLNSSSKNFISTGSSTIIVLNIDRSLLETEDVAGFKQWLSQNPITLEYELAEEEIVPYTEEQQEAWDKIRALMTYKNVTNISSDAYAKIVYMRDNGLDVYETKQNASKKYTETSTKLAEQKITVDGILSEVSNTTSKINELTGELEAINAQIAETNLSVEGLGVKVQNKGGNNLFYYDTEFWNSADIFNLEEFSDTEIKSNSISGMGYKVHNGSAYQSAEAQNGTYTVSFKYKKIGPELANASVKINDEEYSLTGTDWTDFVQIIDVTTNHITVEFISDTNNTLYVADLLGNVGTEKDVWTQNPNETRTDTVTIGKGIKVESTEEETFTRIDADGTRIYNKNNLTDPVTKFTKYGTETEELVVKGQGQISGILTQQIGDQTWFSSLL